MERTSTRSRRPIRLVPGRSVYLMPSGIAGEMELASAFHTAWRLVPLAARRKILDYWSTPTVEVVDDLPADRPGEFRCYGHDIRFLGPACAKMPPAACVGLVLRLLAHAYHGARFEPTHHTSIDLDEEARQRCEVIAIGTVAFDWDLGLYLFALRNWQLGWA